MFVSEKDQQPTRYLICVLFPPGGDSCKSLPALVFKASLTAAVCFLDLCERRQNLLEAHER